MSNTLQDSINELRPTVLKLIAQRDCMRDLLVLIRDELDDRYDGAPDSPTKWMGEHLTAINAVLDRVILPDDVKA